MQESGGMPTTTDAGFQGTDRFIIRRRLGAGGMGVVYEAYDSLARQSVALKTLVRADASALYRLKKEFRSLADIAHPNLVSLFELFMEADMCFFTMELVDGVDFVRYATDASGSLRSEPDLDEPTSSLPDITARIFNESGPVNSDTEHLAARAVRPPPLLLLNTPVQPQRIRHALRQLAEGLCALHEGGKLHRDIKPSNVLVTPAGRVVILDFGVSTELGPTAITETRGFFGTPAYMSPEQAAGRPLSPASDWYGVGVTLYETLTGRLPFEGQYYEVLTKKQEVDPVLPSDLINDVPKDLEELCLNLLQRDPGARPSGGEILHRLAAEDVAPSETTSIRRRSLSFVGREAHLSRLWQAYSTAREGSTVQLYIHGRSGIGKSTLVRNFLQQLEEREKVLILAGRCYERESIPYKALDSVVDSLSRYLVSLPPAGIEALLPRDVAALSKMFPVLLRVEQIAGFRSPMRDIPDPLTLRRRAFASLRELLGRISDRVHLVIFIDDLHWSDVDSMALLENLFRPPDAPSLLLLATFRSEAVQALPFLKGLLKPAGSDDSQDLQVDGLTNDEARELTRSLLSPSTPATEDFVETVVREAEGNPFLIEQFLRWSAGVSGPDTRRISVSEMLEARMRQLPDGARSMLETLAIAARPIASEVIFRAAGLRENAQSLMVSLRSANLIRSTGMAQTVELYHDRIRESIAALLRPNEVRRIHQTLAESLAAAGFDDPELMFEHYVGADQFEPALTYAVIAATKAAAALAFDRAAAFYRKALEVMPRQSDEVQRLKVELGDALANAGRPAEAATAYLEAAERTEPARALDLKRRAAEQLLLGGHVDEGMDVIRTVLDRVGLRLASGPNTALISLLLHRLQLRLRGLRFTERQASAISRDELLRVDICWAVAAGLAMVDNIRGADFQTRHLLLSLRAGEPYRVARALAVEAGFSATSGAPGRRRSERFSKMADELSRRVGHPHAIGLAKLTAGVAAFLVGEWKNALELCGLAEEILRDQCTGVLWELTSAQNFILGSLLYLGNLNEIARRLPVMFATSSERGNLYAATEIKTRMNFMWLAADDPGSARHEVAEALRLWSHKGFHRQHYNAMLAEAQIALYNGDGEAAWVYVTSRWPDLRSTMLLRIQVLRIEALFLKARSALAIAAVDRVRTRSLLREAERLSRAIERERMPWSNPLAWLLRAGVAGLRHDCSQARQWLSQAASGFERADMALYAAVARWRLGELRDSAAGRHLVDETDDWMASQGIKKPASMVRMLAPGFSEAPHAGASWPDNIPNHVLR
jgi:serine/threonine protein kinase/tetratricopeptide (TPR) repeat protein